MKEGRSFKQDATRTAKNVQATTKVKGSAKGEGPGHGLRADELVKKKKNRRKTNKKTPPKMRRLRGGADKPSKGGGRGGSQEASRFAHDVRESIQAKDWPTAYRPGRGNKLLEEGGGLGMCS